MSDQSTYDRWCPDGGFCHHDCSVGCWRVKNAGPLSGVYVGDEWPASVVPVERCEHGNIDPHREYEYVEQGPFGPLYELAVICPGSPTLVEADGER